MKKLTIILFALHASLFTFHEVKAQIINVPADYSTIQQGINAAANGDTVLVQPGTYLENINFTGKNITVTSLYLTSNDTSYINETIINGGGQDRVATFVGGEDSTAMLCGFTLTQGNDWDGGGIYCYESGPSLDHLVVKNNTAVSGGGIYCFSNACPKIHNVTCKDNVADYGGGLYCRHFAAPVVVSSVFTGNNADEGGGIFCFSHGNPELSNVLITNNHSGQGGGISCRQNSNIVLNEVTCSNNTASYGAGIYIGGSNLQGNDVFITNNSASFGGGIWASGSGLVLSNTLITGNLSEEESGGGVFCSGSVPEFTNVQISGNIGGGIIINGASGLSLSYVTITNNTAISGAGIDCSNSDGVFNHVNISNNNAVYNGGGFSCYNSDLELKAVNITSNSAGGEGGGISCSGINNLDFDENDRCNIFMNSALIGLEISSESYLEVIVDTFYVNSPNDYLAHPVGNFSFDILYGLMPQVAANLYVSPFGDNNNSGTTQQEPLKNIRNAFMIIMADSFNPRNIYLLDGTYSPTSNNEYFPLGVPDYITLEGESEEGVILDAEGQTGVLKVFGNKQSMVSYITISGGYDDNGAGLEISGSDATTFHHVTLRNNAATGEGGGCCCWGGSPLFQNVTINNNSAYRGGGLQCNGSSPILQNVDVMTNSAYLGGGIACLGSPELFNVSITGNSASSAGGGIYFYYAGGSFVQVMLSDNNSGWGGGIFATDSSPLLSDVIIEDNSAGEGGGIHCRFSGIIMRDVMIRDNIASTGGGIQMVVSDPVLENVTIKNNTAETGGGICTYQSNPYFNTINRCNIYFNHAITGKELYSEYSSGMEFNVVVDTFTVMHPTDYYVENIEHFSFDILHGKREQVAEDLYVSPLGDNQNSGLTKDEPLRSIDYAFSILMADSLNPREVFLANGTYSSSASEEIFPLVIPDFTNLSGESEEAVIIDAEGQDRVILVYDNAQTLIKRITVTGGYINGDGGGIYCTTSNLVLQNLIIMNNEADSNYGNGGGVCCRGSNISLNQVEMSFNLAGNGGGLSCCDSNEMALENSRISNNSANQGGGIYLSSCSANIRNTIISGNTAVKGGGIFCSGGSTHMINTLIYGDTASWGGGLFSAGGSTVFINSDIIDNNATEVGSGLYVATPFYSSVSVITLTNSIVWGVEEQTICLAPPFPWHGLKNVINVSWSDIIGGEESIQINDNTLNWMEGNIAENPEFLSSYCYQLAPSSPCIDTGTPDTTGLNLPKWDMMGNYRLWDGDNDGDTIVDMGAYEFGSVGVWVPEFQVPGSGFQVEVYPNPAGGNVECRLSIVDCRRVTLKIYDLYGREIRTLVDEIKSPGEYSVRLDVSSLPAGVYLVRLQTGGQSAARKLVVR